MNILARKKCVPCEGETLPLASEAISDYTSQVSDWTVLDNKKIQKKFKFKNFTDALAFVNKVGELAELERHHPDICLFSYNKVKVVLSTHAIGGLSENDFILAAKIDSIST